ncbi:Torsin-like protein [Daphnia magna]|uniref:Torsin-like protein n=1 Tax=Daphnia magna TaxID=35525 RepID=A0A162DC86_9CRUS|nr:Torsin-like protein [Daphnia magna]
MDFYRLMLYIVLLHSCKSTSGYSVLALVTDFFLSSYEKLRCPLGDCCNNHWIPNNTTKLQELLKQDVFGQHIATEVVSRQIEAHLSNPSPSKPLVLSFHGWTGNGKNHVAYLIAKSLFMKETDSQFYHHFISTVHFPHQHNTQLYQDQIRSWVSGNVSRCTQSLFVFDEVDKMPSGVLDGIKAYLDYVDRVDGVDYRKSIFIFLSNTGGKEITKKVHDIWLKGNVKREELTVRDFERLVELGAFNEEGGGLHQSRLIEKHLIDVYVPFLPMEKMHVRLCAENEFNKQKYFPRNKEAALQKIVDGLHYYPEDKELYSTTGCKRVAQRVSLYIAEERYNNRAYERRHHDSSEL